jgi:hypothetical protein
MGITTNSIVSKTTRCHTHGRQVTVGTCGKKKVINGHHTDLDAHRISIHGGGPTGIPKCHPIATDRVMVVVVVFTRCLQMLHPLQSVAAACC